MLTTIILLRFLFFFTFVSSPYFILLIFMEYLNVVVLYSYMTSVVGVLNPTTILVIFALIFERVLYSCILITHED